MMNKWQQFIFIFTLSVCVLVPLTNDIFLSAMPVMNRFFSGQDISLVLSSSLLGLAVGQPFYGPLSDRFGRKPILLAGLVLYMMASACVMSTQVFTCLIIGRFFQAIGIGSAIVSALAIARDACKPEELVGTTSFIMALMGIGPASAPLLGSFLTHLGGWRASFEFLFGLGIFYTVWIIFFFKESQIAKNNQALNFKHIFANYLALIKHSSFISYCLISGFSYGVLFSYLGLSAYFVMEKMHFNILSFGIMMAINALAIIIGALLAAKIKNRISLQNIIQLGITSIFTGGFLMWLLNSFVQENIYTFMLPIFISTLGIGLIRPTASAGALQLVQSKIAGSAASLFSVCSFASGTLMVAITTRIIHGAASFGLFITIMGLGALLVFNLSSLIAYSHRKVVVV